MKNRWLLLAVPATAAMLLTACQKDNATSGSDNVPDGQQKVNVYLTDGPVNYDAVNVDIQSVAVKIDTSDKHYNYGWGWGNTKDTYWDTLNIRPGVYNLLNFRNGIDTMFASGLTAPGTIKQIRIKLGNNNSIVADSVSYPLSVPGDQNIIYINVIGAQRLNTSTFQVWLDFDAARSVVRVRNNEFIIRPFIRMFVPDLTGSIEGRVLPGKADALVSVVAGGDTLVALPDWGGNFKIRGIAVGNGISMLVNATADGYSDTTISNITLAPGEKKNIGTITLHQ